MLFAPQATRVWVSGGAASRDAACRTSSMFLRGAAGAEQSQRRVPQRDISL